MSIEAQLSREEGEALVRRGLGKCELELVTSYCAPLAWNVRRENGDIRSRNGTTFFLDAGEGAFAVTAAHVIDGWLKDGAGPLRVAGDGHAMQVDWDARVIDVHSEMDIATFKIKPEEVTALGKTVLTGNQPSWPPDPPVERCGIYFCGYPGVGTLRSASEITFRAGSLHCVANSVSEKDISTVVESESLLDLMGKGNPPENFDFGGISGGAMLMVIQDRLRSWALAGVIYQGPNPSDDPHELITGLQIIKARRAHFILPNGQLDKSRWQTVSG